MVERFKLTQARFRCYPLFIEPEIQRNHHLYSEGTLSWVFHSVVGVYGELPTRWWHRERQATTWEAYLTANKKFSELVVELYNEGDIVWVQGHELLLLPSFLARKLRSRQVKVGLFLHVPFPSSELFRTLSVSDELLRSMLCADHIGFHIFEYARHFLACCRRILGLPFYSEKGGFLGVDVQGRHVVVTVCHAGIEPSFVTSRLQREGVKQIEGGYRAIARGEAPPGGGDTEFSGALRSAAEEEFDRACGCTCEVTSECECGARTERARTRSMSEDSQASAEAAAAVSAVVRRPAAASGGEADHGEAGAAAAAAAVRSPEAVAAAAVVAAGQRIIVAGVDKMSGLTGLHFKFVAFERLLRRHPEWRDRVCFVQIAVRPRVGLSGARSTQQRRDLSNIRSKIDAIVERVNRELHTSSGQPTIFFEEVEHCTLDQRVGLFSAANVFVSTPLREGMCLYTFEFISTKAAQRENSLVQGASPELRPVVVLSEFSATARVLSGALRVNPWSRDEFETVLLRALSMELGERRARNPVGSKSVALRQ